jgi:hypothetical protein
MAGIYLKQSTASQSRAIGPFLDDTDFKTAETGLTIANTDIKLVVNGAASANKNSGGGTHRVNGLYGITFDATDTATVGEMNVSVVVAGALPVFHKFFVVEEAVYDAMFGASALGYVANAPVNVAQISGDSTAADALELAFDATPGPVPTFGIVDRGTAQSATGTTLVLRSAAAFADDEIIGATILITGGSAGVGQRRIITDYVSSTDTATVATWTTTPTGTITYEIFGTVAPEGVAQTGDAYARLGAPAGASIAADIAAVQSDTDNIQTRIPATLVSGRIDASVGAMASGVLTATAIAADAITDAKVASDVTIASVTGAVGSVTGNVGGNVIGSVGSVSGNVTGSVGSLAAQAKADVNAEMVDVLATDIIADSVPSDGTRPTIAQALYILTQFMLERSVSGTTLTVKKADGSTTLMTLTLNDSTTPTSITRAS